MNHYHQEMLSEIKKNAQATDQSFARSQNYSDSSHKRYGLTVPETRIISRNWANFHRDISLDAFTKLLNALYHGDSTDEKKIAGQLLQYLPKLRKQLDPKLLDDWLNELEGWEEIDSLCQSNFTAQEIIGQWDTWHNSISIFAASNLRQKRRASLVLLTGPVGNSNDERLVAQAFENILKLQSQKNILITKAISWLLRSMIKHHKTDVAKFIKENAATLPPIAIRETKSFTDSTLFSYRFSNSLSPVASCATATKKSLCKSIPT